MRRNIRFSLRMNWWFYTVFGVLFLSGLMWLALHYFAGENADFNGHFGSLKPQLLRIHGGAAMVSLMVLGVLIPTHMQRAWDQGKNRLTGIMMVSLCGLMIVSGYGLYYSGSDTLRFWMSNFHSVSGCLLPLVLVWHTYCGRKERTHRPSM